MVGIAWFRQELEMTETTGVPTLTSRDGTRIAYDRAGTGPALILVGGATADRTAAASLLPVLAERFTVVAYDRRGRGDSGDTAPYAVEREIEDLAALVDAAGGSAFVFGHSSGAVLALRAVAAGLPIAKLAVYEPPFILDDSRPPIPDDYVAHLDALSAAGKREDALAYFMTTAIGIPAEFVEQMRGTPMFESSAKAAHTIAYDGRIMGDTMWGRPLSPEPWRSITIPTLVMDGGASPAWMHAAARALADLLPNARRQTLAGQDHGPADDVLAPALFDFFTS